MEASRSEWDAGRGSHQGGLNLLRQAQLVGPLLPRRAVESAERALLSLISGRLDQTEDFEGLVDLASLSPELFAPPSRGLDSWGEEFSDFLGGERQWLLGELDDSDWLAEEMGRISRVASELRVDTTRLPWTSALWSFVMKRQILMKTMPFLNPIPASARNHHARR